MGSVNRSRALAPTIFIAVAVALVVWFLRPLFHGPAMFLWTAPLVWVPPVVVLAIGSAYAIGELALGAFLVFGFALHNTTEGLAIVAPLAGGRRPSLGRLAGLGFVAGAPAILGAFIGASAFNPELAALLIGFGVGAIVQVIVQIVPAIRDGAGRALYPASVAGILTGVAVLYVTGLLISV